MCDRYSVSLIVMVTNTLNGKGLPALNPSFNTPSVEPTPGAKEDRLKEALELARIRAEDRQRRKKAGRPGGGFSGVLMTRIRKDVLEDLKTEAKIAGVTQREIVERALCKYLGRDG